MAFWSDPGRARKRYRDSSVIAIFKWRLREESQDGIRCRVIQD
jgi:hypothetical protein